MVVEGIFHLRLDPHRQTKEQILVVLFTLPVEGLPLDTAEI